MKVYVVEEEASDGCTYFCRRLLGVFESRDEAETFILLRENTEECTVDEMLLGVPR